MKNSLQACKICPRNCGVDRLSGITGICKASGAVKAAKACLHRWEEPCISGKAGSGTVFFSGCNLHCIFCQNHTISQECIGKEISNERLAQIFIELEAKGAHNINLVTPTPHTYNIVDAIAIAKEKGLKLPIIYNTNAYEKIETIEMLKGSVDIFLPDLKYYSNSAAKEYSFCNDYFKYAAPAILKMIEMVGYPHFNDDGLLIKGVMIRHLILPGMLDETKKILSWIKANIGSDIYISLMSQYTPMYRALNHDKLKRRLKEEEYEEAIDYFFEIGLENGFAQESEAADSCYTPIFDFLGI